MVSTTTVVRKQRNLSFCCAPLGSLCGQIRLSPPDVAVAQTRHTQQWQMGSGIPSKQPNLQTGAQVS